jgi:hypothetical protein
MATLVDHLLAEDKSHDLADVNRAAAWLADHAERWAYVPGDVQALAGWDRNIQAVRSIARRLRSKKAARPAAIGDAEADAIAQRWLHSVSVWPLALDRKGRGALLGKATFRGLRMIPTYMAKDREARIVAWAELEAGFPSGETWWWGGASVFWQLVFLGLFDGSGPAVCQMCGVPIPEKTRKKGAPTKQRLCKSCRWKRWHSGLSQEAKRERWRADYVARRKKGGE